MLIRGMKVSLKCNEEDWPLRGASCFGESPPPNSGETLNQDVSAEHARWTWIYWIMRLKAFGQILATVIHQKRWHRVAANVPHFTKRDTI